MIQFQDDIMHVKQMTTDYYEKLAARIELLEKRLIEVENKLNY
jgi:hypothetical protein